MNVIWIGALAVGCATAILAMMSWRPRIDMAELGTVSEQWLAEHRTGDRDYWGR